MCSPNSLSSINLQSTSNKLLLGSVPDLCLLIMGMEGGGGKDLDLGCKCYV